MIKAPLFRADWYQQQSGVLGTPEELFAHFAAQGSAQGFEPNPFFEPAYYAEKYAAELNGDEPLAHFAREGHRGFNPSPRFDAKRYLADNPDAADKNPLLHYMEIGLPEGRPIYRAESPIIEEQLESAGIGIRRFKKLGREVALLITHYRDHVKPHVREYAIALEQAGYSLVVIMAHDIAVAYPTAVDNLASVIVTRENRGFDFAAWAHTLATIPELWEADEILLTNDSIAGPVGREAFSRMMERVASSSADVVGATSNFEYADHLQSFFLVLKKKALASKAVRSFFGSVVNLSDKNHVIFDYEIPLTPRLRAAGLKIDCLFPAYEKGRNAVIFDWKRLLQNGFPFVKMALLTGPERHLFGEEPLREMGAKGYFTPLIVKPPHVPFTSSKPETTTKGLWERLRLRA